MSTLVVPALVASSVACAAAGPTAPDGAAPSPGVRVGRTEILAARPPPRGLPLEEGYPIAVIDPRPLTRVLRGDFEPPDTLVLAYEEDWLESIRQIVAAAAGQTRVLLLGAGPQARADAFRQLIAAPHVDSFPGAFDSPWVRDYGPLQTYELTSGPLWLDFGYAWSRPQDDRLPSVLSSRMHARVENPGFDLDGGAVISNGQGLCALTRTSLLDAGFAEPDSGELEVFLGSLGCHATAILPVIPGEPTGHVDVIAQFLATDLAMVAWLDPSENGELARTLDAVAEHLLTTATLADYPLEIVRIPLQTSGETFFSYVNATRLRTRLLVPHFNEVPEELERHAYSLLTLALPEAAVVPIDADVMVRLGGAVHCVTLGLGPTAASPPLVKRARAAREAPLTGRSG